MPLDIKVMTVAGSQLVGATWPDPAEVSGTYNLVQRIYLNLLTEEGDVEDDPTWGSSLRSSLLPIPGQNLDQAMHAASAVLSKCKRDLQSNTSTDPAENLVDLRLADLEFSTDLAAWLLTITVVSQVTSQTISMQAT